MITVVIMVILLIILASVFFAGSTKPIDQAAETRFLQELAEVKKGVNVRRLANAKVGTDQKTLNKGFIEVNIENAPETFVSFDPNGMTGYVVDLTTIEYEKQSLGRGYIDLIAGDTITFNVDDVYVYDAAGNVYYAKGFELENGDAYYTEEVDKERLQGPNVEVIDITGGNVEIKVTPIYGGAIKSVVVDGKVATTDDGVIFKVTLTSNGTHLIIASEENGGTTRKSFEISGIELEQGSTPVITKAYINSEGLEYTNRHSASVYVEAENTDMISISVNKFVVPDVNDRLKWKPYTNVTNVILGEGEQIVYIWAKNSENEMTEATAVKITVDTIAPSKDAPSYRISNYKIIITGNQKDATELTYEYGYRKLGESIIIWQSTNEVIDLEPGEKYELFTRATDKVGHTSDSNPKETEEVEAIPSVLEIRCTEKDKWTESKEVTIIYPDTFGVEPYTNVYRIDGGAWTSAATNEKRLNIISNSLVEAAVAVSGEGLVTAFSPIKSIEITTIDRTNPIILDVVKQGGDDPVQEAYDIKATILDEESGIKAWTVTKNENEPSEWENDFEEALTESTEITYAITENGTYYLWVKDVVGHTAVEEINVENIDTTDPEIKSFTVTSGESMATLNVVAQDKNLGLVAYALVSGENKEVTESDWIEIEKTTNEVVREFEIRENNWYTVYFKDESGRISKQQQYIKVRYKVTFDYERNGGEELIDNDSNIDVDNDNNVIECGINEVIDLTKIESSKTRGEFVGWNTDPNARTGLSSYKIGEEDVTLYAIFIERITVSFIYYENGELTKTEVKKDLFNSETEATIEIPEVGTYEDFENIGFTTKTENNAEVEYDGDTLIATDNMTLYMMYQKQVSATYRYYTYDTKTTNENTNNYIYVEEMDNNGAKEYYCYYSESKIFDTTIKANAADISNILAGEVETPRVPSVVKYQSSKNEWALRGWGETENSDAEIKYQEGDKIEIKDDVTLYASYETTVKANKYVHGAAVPEVATGMATMSYNTNVKPASIKLTRAEDAMYKGAAWEPRGWSMYTMVDSNIAVENEGTVEIYVDTNYYAMYQRDVKITSHEYKDKAVEHTGKGYINYKEDVIPAEITMPEIATIELDGKTWYARGYMENENPTSTVSITSGRVVTTDEDLTYYVAYYNNLIATLKGFRQESRVKGTAYVGHDGTFVNAKVTLGAIADETYEGVNWTGAYWTNSSEEMTKYADVNTEVEVTSDVTFYAVLKRDVEVTKYVYNNASSKVNGEAKLNALGEITPAEILIGTSEDVILDGATWNLKEWSTKENSEENGAETTPENSVIKTYEDASYYAIYGKNTNVKVYYMNAVGDNIEDTLAGGLNLTYKGNIISDTIVSLPNLVAVEKHNKTWVPLGYLSSKDGYEITDKTGNISVQNGGEVDPEGEESYFAIYESQINIEKQEHGKTVNAKEYDIRMNSCGEREEVEVALGTISDVVLDSKVWQGNGWSTEENNIETPEYAEDAKVKVVEDTKYYASYERELKVEMREFSTKGVAASKYENVPAYMNHLGSIKLTTVSGIVPTNEEITLEGETWAFEGWTTEEGVESEIYVTSNADIQIGNDIVLYAKYKKEAVATLYAYNNSKLGEHKGVAYANSIGDIKKATIKLDEISEETINNRIWQARGWSTNTSATAGENFVESNGTIEIFKNTNYYASYQRTVRAYFLSYDGTAEVDDARNTKIYMNYIGDTTTGTIVVPSPETYEGWVALGYTELTTPDVEEKDIVVGIIELSEDKEYNAVYQREIKVTYDANGGTPVPASSKGTQKVNAFNMTKPSSPTMTITDVEPVRTGYTFSGKWTTTKDDLSSSTYNKGESYLIKDNITLYAYWNQKEYTLTYELSGGVGTFEAQTGVYGESITIPSEIPTKENHTFLGWSISENAEIVVYNPGETIEIYNDMTLYAWWRNDEIPRTQIAYPVVNGTLVYNGKEQSLISSLSGFDSELMTITGDIETDVGTYTAIIEIADKEKYEWVDGRTDPYEIEWNIQKATISEATAVLAGSNTYGATLNASIEGTIPENATLSYSWHSSEDNIVSENDTEIEGETDPSYVVDEEVIGEYVYTKIEVEHANYEQKTLVAMTDEVIGKATVTKPTVSGERVFNYDGKTKTLDLVGLDKSLVEATGTLSAIEGGKYTVTLTLKDNKKYTWADGKSEPINIEWEIKEVKFDVTASISGDATFGNKVEALVNGELPEEATVEYEWFVSEDAEVSEDDTKIESATGAEYTIGSEATGDYIYVKVTINAENAKTTEIIAISTSTVAKKKVAKPTMSGDGIFEFNGKQQTLEFNGIVSSLMIVENNKATNAGDYEATVSLNDTENYMWDDGKIDALGFAWQITDAWLADVVQVGDYVSYPVEYKNVLSHTNSEGKEFTSTLEGWRVLSIEEDGTVNLVSAGVPMTYFRGDLTEEVVSNLTEGFLTTEFTTSTLNTYIKNGFDDNLSLSELFTNKYTATTDGITPKVRSMIKEDVLAITGASDLIHDELINNAEYKEMLDNKSYYWLASAYNSTDIWYINAYGYSRINIESSEAGIRPVVSLKSTVRTSAVDASGEFNIQIADAVLLSEVAESGDYVRYPVEYENVVTEDALSGTQYTSTLEGWKVIGSESDGTIRIVSAGVPMTYYHAVGTSAQSALKLTDGFLTTAFSATENNTYRKNGFNSKSTLTKVFTNGYTSTVRSMIKEDILKLTGLTDLTYMQEIPDIYNILRIDSLYYLASVRDENELWLFYNNGENVGSGYLELGIRPVATIKSTVMTTGKNRIGTWDIEIDAESGAIKLAEPTLKEDVTYTYTGEEHTVELNGFDSETMEIDGNVETKADTYTATIKIKDTSKYRWPDGTVAPITITWTIKKASMGVVANIEGTNAWGNTLTVSASVSPDTIKPKYQWYISSDDVESADDTSITDASGETLELTSDMIGKYVYVKVTAQAENYETKEVTVFTSEAVGKAPINNVTASISGDVTFGNKVEALVNGELPEGATVEYEWFVSEDAEASDNDTKLENATGAEYVIGSEATGDYIYVKVTITADNYETTEIIGISGNVVAKKKVAKPTMSGDGIFEFNGKEQTLEFNGIVSGLMIVENNKETNAGEYEASVRLSDEENYMWDDGKIDALSFGWEITDAWLADVVKVGDYVSYPVEYENVVTRTDPNTGATCTSEYEGWRVISIEEDGTVNLVSAGVPMTYYNTHGKSAASVTKLTDNFLTTVFSTTEGNTYRENGFDENLSLKELFTNKYTATTDGITPKVRSMIKQDILAITGASNLTAYEYLTDEIYDNLFANDSWYYLASSEGNYLWRIEQTGMVHQTSDIALGVRPVVSLKSTVRTSAVDASGEFNIQIADAVLLSDVMESGDYVRYPIEYNNVNTPDWNGNPYYSSLEGWRIIGKESDGTINLISAGIPLTYFHQYESSATTIDKLTNNFLNVSFSSTDDYTYRESGFDSSKSLTKIFTNGYAATKYDGSTPKVRSITEQDIIGIVGGNSIQHPQMLDYKNLFDIGGYYLTTKPWDEYSMYIVCFDGNIGCFSGTLGIRPVATIKSTVKTTGKNRIGTWDIEIDSESGAIKLAVPTLKEDVTYTYTGEEHTVELNGFDSETMEIDGNVETKADTYTATIKIKDTSKYRWPDGTVAPITITWTIKKASMGVVANIEGTNAWGNTLTVSASVSPDTIKPKYQWYISSDDVESANDTPITDASGEKLELTEDMIGKYVYVKVTAEAANYETKEVTVFTSEAVGKAPINNVTASISGDVTFGNKVEALVNGELPEGATVEYEWFVSEDAEASEDDTKVESATGAEYVIGSEATGDYIYVKVTITADNYETTEIIGISGNVVAKKKVAKPTMSGDGIFEFNGKEQTLEFNGIVSGLMIVENNKETNAGEYEASVSLNDTENYMWDDEKIDALSFAWQITDAWLADVVKVGDYVSYPVEYKNVYDMEGATITEKGWRVLSIEEDGTVNLVSTSVPLSYHHLKGKSDESIANLTENFFTTPFKQAETDYNMFWTNGFTSNSSLREAFTNKYTATTDGITPKVRSMIKEDVLEITGKTDLVQDEYLTNEEYADLLINSGYSYWLASKHTDEDALWFVRSDGKTGWNYYSAVGVRPVVSLRSTVRTSAIDADGEYNIDIADAVLLSGVMESGDYVKYPVEYENVISTTNSEGTIYSTLEGWRVIGKEADGSINLVSAGIPLNYHHLKGKAPESISNLTDNLLTTPLRASETDYNMYWANGFDSSKSLTKVFTNGYAVVKADGTTPKVRSMIKEDFLSITGASDLVDGEYLTNEQYENLLVNDGCYWLASVHTDTNALWYVNHYGLTSWNYYTALGVRPVATIKSTVMTTGKNRIGTWDIQIDNSEAKIPVAAPTLSGDGIYEFNGKEQTVELNGFDSSVMNITGNVEVNAGTYESIVSLKDTYKYKWADGSIEDKNIEWTITDAWLADVVKVGDYVSYPVEYENVVSYTDENGVEYASTKEGWRVISIEEDGTVNLVSAGVPMTYYHAYASIEESVTNLTDEFLTTTFSTADNNTYRKNGFNENLSLKELFTNKYTATTDGITPAVKSIMPEDVIEVTGVSSISNGMSVNNDEYKNLLHNNTYYWLACDSNEANLWFVNGADGKVYGNNDVEYGVRPVVSLRSTVRTSAIDASGEFNIEIANAMLLSSVIERGDYVKYPVDYNNVITDTDINTGTTYVSDYEGWRILGKESDGTINIVSAGVPLTYYYGDNQSNTITALTTNFLSIPFSTSTTEGYRENGFTSSKSLSKIFQNGYTVRVKSMEKSDVLKVTGESDISNGMSVSNDEYKNLLHNNAYYWLASASNQTNLWFVNGADGNIYGSNGETSGVRPVATIKSTVKTTGKNRIGTWDIEIDASEAQIPVAVPTLSGDGIYEFNGKEQTVELNGFDSDIMSITGNVEVNAGTYEATLSLKDTYKYKWADGSIEDKNIEWTITDAWLADVVKVGDYVSYPVEYENVVSYRNADNTVSYTSTYEGWRVISIEEDGTVNLISAGIPMTYFHTYGNAIESESNLTDNFLTTPFSTSEANTYRNSGFDDNLSLSELFTNKYTATTDGITPAVRSLKKEDVLSVTGKSDLAHGEYLTDIKYKNMFDIGGIYHIALAEDENCIWNIGYDAKAHIDTDAYNDELGIRPVVSLRSTVRTSAVDASGEYNIQIADAVVLEDVAIEGDYVRYPVEYNNVSTADGNGTYTSTYEGWRVLGKESDGTIRLVSAGVPMTYYHSWGANTESVENLTDKFLTTELSTAGNTYRTNGFNANKSLTKIFANGYTATKSDGSTPNVRSIVKEDILKMTGASDLTYAGYLTADEYKHLFNIDAVYFVASAGDENNLWGVHASGQVGYYYSETGVRPVATIKSTVKTTGKNRIGTWDIEIDAESGAIKLAEPTVSGEYVYNQEEQTVELKGFDLDTMELTGQVSASNAGTYEVTVSIKDVSKYRWSDGTIVPRKLSWTIQKAEIGLTVNIAGNNNFAQCLTAEYTISPSHIKPKFQWYYNDEKSTEGGTPIEDASGESYTVGENLIGKYIYVIVTAEDENCVTKVVSDVTDEEKNGSATVLKVKLKIPTKTDTSYGIVGGSGQIVELELNDFDENTMSITGNIATESGTCTATVSIKEPNKYMWDDGTVGDIKIEWYVSYEPPKQEIYDVPI